MCVFKLYRRLNFRLQIWHGKRRSSRTCFFIRLFDIFGVSLPRNLGSRRRRSHVLGKRSSSEVAGEDGMLIMSKESESVCSVSLKAGVMGQSAAGGTMAEEVEPRNSDACAVLIMRFLGLPSNSWTGIKGSP